MLQNASITSFTVSELLREHQQGGKITPPPPHTHTLIRVNILFWSVLISHAEEGNFRVVLHSTCQVFDHLILSALLSKT